MKVKDYCEWVRKERRVCKLMEMCCYNCQTGMSPEFIPELEKRWHETDLIELADMFQRADEHGGNQ